MLAPGSATAAGKAALAKPIVTKDVDVDLVDRLVDADQEILAFRPKKDLERVRNGSRIELAQPAGRPSPWSAVVYDQHGNTTQLFIVRRPIPATGEPAQSVALYGLGDELVASIEPRYRFSIPDTTQAPKDSSLKLTWLRSLRDGLGQETGGWFDFARFRVEELLRGLEAETGKSGGQGKAGHGRVGVSSARELPNPSSLYGLMDTTTGLSSIHEALQIDRRLRTQVTRELPSVALSSLQGPPLASHPWEDMSNALGGTAPSEPLARATPARFYYVRFSSLDHLFRLLDESDAWLTPLVSMGSGLSQNQDLGKRYETQLGLQRSLAGRVLGPRVVTDLAVVGSDPYLREGSDLTFIFRSKNVAAFQAGLAQAMAAHASAHGTPKIEIVGYMGETITITRTLDGAVSQHRADVGSFSLVSNSLGAIKLVIETIKHRNPALADEPDFGYMLARDADVPADVLAFMSDAFVAEVVGPRQKILETRRLIALSDLTTPGYAALLFGWMMGRPPRDADEMLAAGVLAKDELKHVGGQAIAWTPGSAARSTWGTVAALTPLIDLPVPEHVTTTERDAYRLFADSYQNNWSTYMDPACLRIKFDGTGKGSMTTDLRVLPIIDASEYRKMQRSVGEARIAIAGGQAGVQVSLGVGPDAELRKAVGEIARELPSPLRAQLDWLGSVAFLGVDDRFDAKPIFNMVNREASKDEELAKLLVEAPIHAGIGVRNRLTAALTIGAIRKMVQDSAPGAIEWREGGKHRGVSYVTVGATRTGEARKLAGDIKLYYSFCKDYLLLSLGEATLKARIDECVDGKLVKPAPTEKAGNKQNPQLVFSVGMKTGGPIWQLASAGLRASLDDAQEGSRQLAEAVLRGAPGLDPTALRDLALAYFGIAPEDSDGVDLLAKPRSAISFRRRGWQAKTLLVPAAQESAVGRFLARFLKARAEIAFDREVSPHPPGSTTEMGSLHVVVSVGAP